MQVCILCGGSGTRLKEMSEFIPKPLIPIGPYPMVVHIMKLYAHYGYKDFVLALGYKQEAFKMYFRNYDIINHDVTFRTGIPTNPIYTGREEQWCVVLSDTGDNTFKGARLKRIEQYIQGDTFMLTYGDAVSDVDLDKLLSFHKSHGRLVTVTGVHPAPRFGEIHHDNGKVISFSEKPHDDECLINGGFMICDRKIFDYLTEDSWCDLEVGPLELLAAKDELRVYHHRGFWKSMDTLKDMGELQTMWNEGKAKWRVG